MAETILRMYGIQKYFPGVHALDNAQLEVRAGEVMALIGENGAGKSTLMKILTGVYTKDEGTIELFGSPVEIHSPRDAQAKGISIVHQELNLMQDLQDNLGLTYLFITHDLSVVKYISNDILVMYLGQMVEKAPSDKLFKKPMHPYTQALLSAIPIPNPKVPMNRITMKGELTSPINPEKGCRFAKRCPYATDACRQQDMVLTEEEPGHFVTCLRVQRGEI